MSRILHNSFTIAWGILGVTILVLLLITNYSIILKEIYITIETSTIFQVIAKLLCNLLDISAFHEYASILSK